MFSDDCLYQEFANEYPNVVRITCLLKENGTIPDSPTNDCSGIYNCKFYKQKREVSREERCFDPVEHPSHYTEGREYEPKDVIYDWGLDFNLGSAVKYISRAGRKDDIIQDLKKAQQFIQFEIDAIEKKRGKT